MTRRANVKAEPGREPEREGAEHQTPPQQHSNDDAAPVGAGAVGYRRYDPTLPPASTQRRVQIALTVKEVPVRLNGRRGPRMDLRRHVPGTDRAREAGRHRGVHPETTRATIPHSMDFHAAQIDPKVAFRSVAPGSR